MAVSLQDLDTIFNYDPVTHSIGQLPTHRPTSFDATGIPSIAESANPGQYTRPGSEQRLPQVLTGGSQTQGRAAPGITALDIPTTAPTAMPTMREQPANPLAIEKMLSPAQQKGGVGPKLYRADMPQITDYTPGAFNEQREAQLNYAQMHPWGSAVSEHPGTWGKIAHGLAQVGNIAGDIVAPRIMSEIPGTQLGNEFQQAQQAGLAGEAARQGLENAQTEEARGRAWTAMHPGEAETAKEQAEFNFKDQAMRAAGYQPGSPEYNKGVLGVEPQSPEAQAFNAELQRIRDPLQAWQNVNAAKLAAQPGTAPIGGGGVQQQNAELQQLTAKMPPDKAQNFVSAFAARPTDTQDQAHKRLDDAKAAAQLFQSGEEADIKRGDQLLQRQIENNRQAEAAEQKREEQGSEIVRAVDKDGKVHLISRADYEANKGNYTGAPMKMNEAALTKATDHATNINEMQARMNALAGAAQKFEWGDSGQKSIVNQALTDVHRSYADDIIGIPISQYIANNIKRWGLEGAHPETRAYITALLSAREAALGLPKEITGGSRQSDIAANALWQTLPGGATPSAGWAIGQLKAMQSTIDRLKNTRVPEVPGLPSEQKDPSLYQYTASAPGGKTYYSDDQKTWYDQDGNELQRPGR